MTTGPLIGISGRRRSIRRVGGFPENFLPLETDLHLANYPDCVTAAGGLAVTLSITSNAAALVDRLDGVVLTGGADVDPSAYGAEPHPQLDATEPARDAFEIALARAAFAKGVPLLAICRGMQVLNVALGGTLHQHIEGHAAWGLPVDALVHDAIFADGSLASELYGHRTAVNTLHHQALDAVGEGLVVTGRADDGTIEAVEKPGSPVLAVQWHPELVAAQPDPCFVWLIQAAQTARLPR